MLLHYTLVAVISALVSTATWMTLRRKQEEQAIQETRYEDSAVLIETLKMAVGQGGLEEQTARFIYGVWGHLVTSIGGVPCACGNTTLHCDKDQTIIDKIKHTAEWCDVEDEHDG